MDGWSVTTVEALKSADGIGSGCCQSSCESTDAYHPVQRKLADGNGVQCGFCTPGWVMNMYSLLERNKDKAPLEVEEIEKQFDGNLCRCTGYRAILQSFHAFAKPDLASPEDRHRSMRHPPPKTLSSTAVRHYVSQGGELQWYSVSSLDQLGQLLESGAVGQKPALVCSSTGIRGVMKYYEGRPATLTVLPPVSIEISRLPELRQRPEILRGILRGGGASGGGGFLLKAGAALSLTDLIDALKAEGSSPNSQTLAAHLSRVAGHQVRNVAAWAGNLGLARAKPAFVSDVASCLAALGTTLTIFQAKGKTSEVSVQDYVDGAFPGAEDTTLIVAGKIPLPQENDGQTLNLFRCYKTAQRHVNSHSIVNGCFLLSVDLQTKTVKGARLFFGGVCQKLLRASKMEAALEGKPVDSDETYQAALQALSEDIAGAGGICKDPKISEAYRLALAKAHFFRLHLSVLDKLGVLPAHNSSALTPFATAASRPAIKAKQSFDVQKEHAPVSEAIPKLGAIMSTSGEAIYPSDRFAASPNTLYGAFVIADRANRKLLSLDASAALSSPGVVDFLTAADVPRGKTLQYDEPLFCAAGEVVPYEGAAVGFVVAESAELALAAVSKVRLTWDGTGSRLGTSSQPITNLQAARQRGSFITNAEMDKKLARLDEAGGLRRRGLPLHRACFSVDQQESEEDRRNRGGAVSSNLHEVSGEVKTGGQLHFYMEPQTTMAIPTEDGGLELWCGTQFPAFTQLTVCQLLGLPAHQVNIKVRRVGGAFGGKLSRQGPLAAACSLAALKSRRPIFGCNERLTDMRMTQGREQCEVTYSATCDNDGRVESLEMDWHIDVGWDGTDAAGDIAMLVNFSDNAFYTPNFKCNSTAYKSHTVPRTSVRAPGVIQSITAHEVIMEHVSRSLGLDFEWVQEKNFYQPGQKTPWGDVIGSDAFNWTMPQVWAKLREDSSFDLRRQAVERFNAGSRWRKRGIAMTPVKYGMGLDVFQAMATVCIFSADGTVLVNHNGCEIGQGIHTKVAQVVAYSLGLDLSMVRIADTESNQAPNTAATGGSGTSETSAQAARVACEELSKRLAPYLAKEKDWVKALAAAATDNVSLSAQGWYVHEKAAGLNSYATYGAAVSEVEVDVLTGEMEILRADILMDLGQQLNAAVDVGQLEGGFVMSLGFFFTEQVLFNDEGQLLNVGTWEYKIPSYCEVPHEFNVSLMTPAIPNPNGVLGSKASAEPPMSLANSAYFAVKFAIYAARAELGQGNGFFQLPLPCTVEEIQRACALDDEAFRMSS